jgi:hypothetical protein
VVVPTAPSQNYDQFSEQVRLYNSKEPFNFETSSRLKEFETYVSIYAAYLYDSFKLYANALHKLLSEQTFLNDQIIDQIASNGTKIVETIIKMKTYKSITGATMKLDDNGDSEGNFSVLAFQQVTNNKHVYGNFACSYQMRPVGQFFQQWDDFPVSWYHPLWYPLTVPVSVEGVQDLHQHPDNMGRFRQAERRAQLRFQQRTLSQAQHPPEQHHCGRSAGHPAVLRRRDNDEYLPEVEDRAGNRRVVVEDRPQRDPQLLRTGYSF